MLDPFWAKVDQSAGSDACWPWTGLDNGKAGYGVFYPRHAKKIYAHRHAYELVKGPIPEGLQLDHLCRNRACVNPAHLEPVTNRENSLRGNSRNAINARKTHCKHGHNNWGRRRDRSGRVCLTCEPSRVRISALVMAALDPASRSGSDRPLPDSDSGPTQTRTPGHRLTAAGPRRPAPTGSLPPGPVGAPSPERVP